MSIDDKINKLLAPLRTVTTFIQKAYKWLTETKIYYWLEREAYDPQPRSYKQLLWAGLCGALIMASFVKYARYDERRDTIARIGGDANTEIARIQTKASLDRAALFACDNRVKQLERSCVASSANVAPIPLPEKKFVAVPRSNRRKAAEKVDSQPCPLC